VSAHVLTARVVFFSVFFGDHVRSTGLGSSQKASVVQTDVRGARRRVPEKHARTQLKTLGREAPRKRSLLRTNGARPDRTGVYQGGPSGPRRSDNCTSVREKAYGNFRQKHSCTTSKKNMKNTHHTPAPIGRPRCGGGRPMGAGVCGGWGRVCAALPSYCSFTVIAEEMQN